MKQSANDAAEAKPFHVSPGGLSDLKGRFLLVSYHFPPLPTAGAVRWGRFAELAAERGWVLDVIAGHPSEHNRTDLPALERLPPGTRVYGVQRRLSALQRAGVVAAKALSVRRGRRTPVAGTASGGAPQTSLAPDEMRRKPWNLGYARRGILTLTADRGEQLWARDAARLGRGVLRAGTHRLVISCGPPHMAHVAARKLADIAGLPFVMDLRDPWSLERRLPRERAHPLYFALARRREERCVGSADLVVTNTDEVCEAMQRRYSGDGARFLTVLNGYDELDLPRQAAGGRGTFKITYAGAIYLDRNPETLFRAARKAVSELGLTPEDLAIELIGSVSHFGGVPTAEIAARCGVREFVHLHPQQDRNRLWDMLADASMLVSLPQDSPWAIPSKIYEYMQFNAWLLILTQEGSPTARLLSGSGADVVPPSDVSRIADVIVRRYRERASGLRPPRIGEARFSRRAQASRLFDALECAVLGVL